MRMRRNAMADQAKAVSLAIAAAFGEDITDALGDLES